MSNNTFPAMSKETAMGSGSDNLQVFIEHGFFYKVSISNRGLEPQIYGHHTYFIKSFFLFLLPLLMKTLLHLRVDLTDGFNFFLNF